MRLLVNPEIVRRLVALVGLLVALVMFFFQADYIIEVELVSFDRMQRSSRSAVTPQEVSGPQWRAAVDDLLSHNKGQTPEKWLANRSDDFIIGGKELYFVPGEEPFDLAVGQQRRRDHRTYLVFNDGNDKHYITIEKLRAGWAFDAPVDIATPMRRWSWIALVLGMAGYWFLPKARKPEGGLGYYRLWGTVVSDILGLAICGLCFGLIISEAMEEETGLLSIFDFDSGVGGLAAGMFLLSLVGLVIMSIGVWYRNFWISFVDDGIERHTAMSVKHFAYNDMDTARIDTMPLSKWVMIASMVGAAGGSVRSAGHAAMLSGQEHQGLGVTLKNGQTKWVRLEGFQYPRKLIASLRDHGVELDEALKQMLED